jgi:hypothetical protein
MTLENLRQKCIYYHSKTDSDNLLNDKYWEYMVDFAKTCADIKDPTFNSNCAYGVMNSLQLNVTDIETCMSNAIKHPINHLLFKEDKAFLSYSVFKVPTLIVNGVTYKGPWLVNSIFEEICSHFSFNDKNTNAEMCKQFLINENSQNENSYLGLAILSISITVILIIFLFLYKRSFDKSLDETIAEKIKKQAQGSLGQYHIFSDTNNSIRGIEIEKSIN